MRKFATLLIFSLAACGFGAAQGSQSSTPQTARQALMEMFSSTGSGTFVKHLPAATLNALENAGALKALQQYSMLASQFHRTGNQLETFETGPVLLANDDPKTGQRVEVIVDSDSVQGDDDNIELSFRTYKDKQMQRTPFMPRITFCMKMESGVWKLNEILFSIRVPLADPDFLKSITESMKSRTATMMQPQLQSSPSTVTFGGDSAVVASMRSILTAEKIYKSTYASIGYTCALSDLDGFGGGEPNEHQAMLIASGLASGKKQGYIFALSRCQGTPASSFHLTAVPAGNSFGRRAFCAEQSGDIRYSTDGSAITCQASGIPLP
ncbi:MAG: hypothetical protein WBV55_08375 [Candidatus Sulfotelmatobacter sp.]